MPFRVKLRLPAHHGMTHNIHREATVAKLTLRYVHQYRDRHGKLRRYVRRPGFPRTSLPGLPGSREFMAAYEDAMSSAAPVRYSKHGAGTLGNLVTDFYRSAEFANLKPSSQAVYRVVLGTLVEAHGHRLVRDLPTTKARKIIEEIGANRPGMANLTRSVFRRVMGYAVSTGLRNDNPLAGVPSYRLGTRHTWTDDQIAAFENCWPLGTRERLAFALLLYTAQRGGDVVKMRRSDLKNGVIRIIQQKTGAEMAITIHPALTRALKAGPTNGLYLIGDPHGRPIKRATLTRLIGGAAKKAGLPSKCVAHGLRKAALRRLAEHGSTTKEIAAVSGHRTLGEIERYTAQADQGRLSRSAIGKLPDESGT
jgi:integrase